MYSLWLWNGSDWINFCSNDDEVKAVDLAEYLFTVNSEAGTGRTAYKVVDDMLDETIFRVCEDGIDEEAFAND